MNLRKCLLTKNDCYKAGKKITPKGVMWHSTGANNPNIKRYVQPDDGKLGDNKYNNDWNRSGTGACVHAFIGLDKNGKVCTYQTLPWNYRGWHCGGSGNDRYISFEICEDDLKDKSYFEKVYKEAVELTAYLCKQYNLNPNGSNVIICHQDGYKLGIATNHSDIYHWFNKFGKDMNDVRKDVAVAMGKTTSGSSSKPSTSKPSASTSGKTTLKVDGWWGKDTTKRLQQIFKTPVDGIVSNQDPAQKKYLLRADSGSWDFKGQGNGSDLIGAMQKKVGVNDDGFMGPKTIKAWQKYLGVSVDGKMGEKTVKAIQKWVNNQV